MWAMQSRISIMHTTKIINHQSLLTLTQVSSTNTNFFIFLLYHVLTVLNIRTKNRSGISCSFFTIYFLMYHVTPFLTLVVRFACLLAKMRDQLSTCTYGLLTISHILGTQACISNHLYQ